MSLASSRPEIKSTLIDSFNPCAQNRSGYLRFKQRRVLPHFPQGISENFNENISAAVDESAHRLVASALEPTLEINRAHRLRDVTPLD